MKLLNFLIVTAILLFYAQHAYPSNVDSEHLASEKFMPAIETDSHIVIDGKLNDVAWEHATFSDDFQQREPGDGDPPTERTEIGCLYDNENLYFGIRCYDSEPEKIIRTELRRDARMDDDDFFEIILDTYHDRRSGFYFVINPYGNRRDARLSDEGRNYNPDWDGIWECKSTINHKGWFAEIAIPWKTLRFVEGDKIYFGANFGRTIRRKNEKLDWNHIPREMGGFSLFRLSKAGHVGPFNGLQMGGNFELQPYMLGGMQRDTQTEFKFDNVRDFGMDAKINLTSNLVADLTYNTDFAQVEADQERVNLSRFSLYFPEKRSFFLEGAEIFSIGSSGRHFRRGGGGDSNPVIFYSRRIGIEQGRQIPLWGGVKLTGKIGKTTIGLLNMQTQTTDITSDDASVSIPTTNFGVFRIKQDVFSRSSIGLMLTNKVVEQNLRYNQAFAMDGSLALTPNLSLNSLVGGSHTSDEKNQQSGIATVNLGYRSDRYQANFGFMDIEPNFNAEMGFIRRTDIRKSSARFTFSPRSKKFAAVRKFSYSLRGSYLTDHNNHKLDHDLTFSYSIEFQSSARLNINLRREYEYLSYDWEVRDGIEIPQGVYEGYSISTWILTNQSKPMSTRINLSSSDYYNGKRYSIGSGIEFNRIKKLKFDADLNLNRVNLRQGNFTTFTLSNRMVYAFSTTMYLKAYIQYNSDRLRYEGRVKWNANILFRYIYKPGSDIYIVYNQEQLVGSDNNEIRNRTLMAKVVYFWRK